MIRISLPASRKCIGEMNGFWHSAAPQAKGQATAQRCAAA